MFRRPTKKQLMIRRGIVMTVMTLSVLVIVTGIILFVLGFRLNSERGLEQGALVQFDTNPTGAQVTIDGVDTRLRTPGKRTLLAGPHDFLITRSGYQPWTKKLDLTAGTLTWLDYIRMVPTDLKNEVVASYASLSAAKASPDFRTMILLEKSDVPLFQLVDLRAQEVRSSTLALPADLYSDSSQPNHVFTIAEWDAGGRYVLLKHEYGGQVEWVVVDSQNVAASVNVSRLLSVNVSDLRFAGTNGTVLYGLIDGSVRKLDLGAATISRALISNVVSFDIYETNILTYIALDTEDPARQLMGVYRDGDQSPHVIGTAPRDTQVKIDTVRYFSDDYVAISEGADVTVLKGSYPTSSGAEVSSLQPFASFTTASAVTHLSFSPEGDYLLAQSGAGFVGYELEYKRLTTASDATLDTSAPQTLQWLDDDHVWAVYGTSLVMREFDGANTHVIGAALAGFDAMLSQNGRYIYSVAKEGDVYHLQRVSMLID